MYNINPLDSFEMTNDQTRPGKEKVRMPDEFGYEFVRNGENTVLAFKHDKVKEDIEILLSHYYKHGYADWLPRLVNSQFKKCVLKFRATLDVWEMIPISKVFTKDEIYFRCLEEGPSYTEFIKKCRSTTLRGLTSLTETDIEEEYYFPEGYAGYDSIIHERNLIHWDDRDSIDDVKYAFMPYNGRIDNFQEIASDFLDSLKIDPFDFNLQMDTLGELKNTKMYDPASRRTALMREFWTEDISLSEPYIAKRAVVLVEPGSSRDTCVGDPSTIAKVKCINKICRTILERCPHSASAPAHLATARLQRVLERNIYLHLDFKKYGLAFARALQNLMLQVIGHKYSIDVEDLLITHFYILIDGELYETCRGLTLGWVDCLNELCVHALLWDLSYRKGLKFDWIAFNDDVEISFNANDSCAVEKATMVRASVLVMFNIYDIIISISKTYASRASLFLEKYFRFKEKYSLDMEKRQLSCKSYARSLVSSQPWKAKMNFAIAHLVWPDEDVASRCIITCPVEFDKRERRSSLYVGGWYPTASTTLDSGIEDQSQDFLGLSCEITKISLPDISSKPTPVSKQEDITRSKIKMIERCNPPKEGREKFSFVDVPYDVNFEAEGVFEVRHMWTQSYHIRKGDNFPTVWNHAMVALRDQAKVFDPGIV